jgi:hypothetical protein
MQIVELQLSHYNFCCPATGIQLFSRKGPQVSPALRAAWVAFTIHTGGGLMAETATVVIDMDTDMDAI